MSDAAAPPVADGFAVVRLRLPAAEHGAFAEALTALAPEPVAVSILPADAGPWTVEALFDRPPAAGALSALLADVAAALGVATPDAAVEAVPDRDWVRESLLGLGPVAAGRFRVIGSHLAHGRPGRFTLLVDAGQAFGSGHHETTRGCLLALDWLADWLRPRRVLDLGCGSGVLAMAAARVFPVPVVATDIDPVAVFTARANARRNGLGNRLTVLTSEGFAAPAIGRAPPFDLILANILAQPLKALAPDMARHLAPGGRIVLSGLLRRQEPALRAVYRAAGFRLVRRFALGQWPTLVLEGGGPH